MNQRPIFKLSPRLMKCASNVRNGARLVDVGTDHAYLPIWLAKKRVIKSAIAADIKKGPLMAAEKNIVKYHVDEVVKTILSDGLSKISADKVDDVVIAGMGGDIITQILCRTPWIKNPDKLFILQPMTCEEKVRLFLYENGFEVVCEETVKSEGRVYLVIVCRWTGTKRDYNETSLYVGELLKNLSPTNKEYLKKVVRHLKNKSCSEANKQQILDIISEINSYI